MDIMAGLQTVTLLVTCNPLSSLFGTYGGPREVTHNSTQAHDINFALQEGQTIVAVHDDKKPCVSISEMM